MILDVYNVPPHHGLPFNSIEAFIEATHRLVTVDKELCRVRYI